MPRAHASLRRKTRHVEIVMPDGSATRMDCEHLAVLQQQDQMTLQHVVEDVDALRLPRLDNRKVTPDFVLNGARMVPLSLLVI